MAGLHYAVTSQQSRKRLPDHPDKDDLHPISQQCLSSALEFALQSEPQNLARSFVHLPADTAFHCLFMGIAFIQENFPAPAVHWLERGRSQENRLRLFFAMGVKAASFPGARRLLRSIQSDLPQMTVQHMGKELESIPEYLKVVYLYPEAFELGVRSRLRCAQIFERYNQIEEAVKIYKELADQDIEEAKYAKEKLIELKKEEKRYD